MCAENKFMQTKNSYLELLVDLIPHAISRIASWN